MNLDDLYSELTLKTKAKLVLLVMDGVGDLAADGSDSCRSASGLWPLSEDLCMQVRYLAEHRIQYRWKQTRHIRFSAGRW